MTKKKVSFVNTLYNTVDWKNRKQKKNAGLSLKLDKYCELVLLLRMGQVLMVLVRFPLGVLQKKDGNNTSN